MSTLSAEQHAWYEAACALVDRDRLTELVVGMVDIPSPTGEEAELARWLTATLDAAGFDSHYQAIDDRQANAVARLRGDGTGEDLLLYAPIDTLTVGDPVEDVPWIGPELRADMRPRAEVHGDHVVGLGASNPKGHGAAVIAAAEAIAKAGVPLRGDLIVGFGAGGMPTNGRTARGLSRRNAGHGVGCSFLLEQGWWADHALIAKPGWSVAWEEVGLCWFEVRVRGTYTYVGSRHRMPYRNAIDDAATVIAALEHWFPEYAARHTDGLVAPQGIVAAIEGGWPRMAAVSPALCRFMIDLRTSPRSTPADVRREFADALDAILTEHPGIELDWDMVLSIPGTRTSPDAPVIVATTAAWEEESGRPHEPIVANSGATDANILRARGLPTARIGMDRIGGEAPLPLDFSSGMNVVDIREAVRLTRTIVHTTIALCTRERSIP
ncbi:M20 family metallopeptidase [Rhodococcus sp. NPDC056743]|uniref:M20 family metallopeptidase n=1 Tax=Rhodococcus sp. NPDC056743 TaxID=3345934 RepID=UPI003671938D